MNKDNELDIYIKLKYGYPLTTYSYEEMPDELIIILCTEHRKKFLHGPINLRKKSIRLLKAQIGFSFASKAAFGSENWYDSVEAWNIIKEYYDRDI